MILTHKQEVLEHIGETSSTIYDKAYHQGRADALSIDMDKPMNFTDEQKAWIKNYIIINAKRQRADAIDEFLSIMKREIHIETYFMDRNFKHTIEEIAEQLKEQN